MIQNYGSVGTVRTNRMLACILCAAIAVLLAAVNAMADNGPERARRQPAKMSYLDNGVIRLGVDLNLGGAITYLSRSGTEQNLVNSYDCGRQVQCRTIRARSLLRLPESPKPEWRFIGWNPIQVGDAFGNASKLLEHSNDSKQIYVKCIPLHWPELDNVASECTYECWLSLDGPAVHARCQLVNHRPDHTQYPARHQDDQPDPGSPHQIGT